MGFPEKFATSALRLANNNLDQAAVLVQNMAARASDLEKGVIETSSSGSLTPNMVGQTSFNSMNSAISASQNQGLSSNSNSSQNSHSNPSNRERDSHGGSHGSHGSGGGGSGGGGGGRERERERERDSHSGGHSGSGSHSSSHSGSHGNNNSNSNTTRESSNSHSNSHGTGSHGKMQNSLDTNFATDTLLSDEVDPILSPREDLMKLDQEVSWQCDLCVYGDMCVW
jgi:hypothetical protein